MLFNDGTLDSSKQAIGCIHMAGILYLISVGLCEFNPNSTSGLLVLTFHYFLWGIMLLSLIYNHITHSEANLHFFPESS